MRTYFPIRPPAILRTVVPCLIAAWAACGGTAAAQVQVKVLEDGTRMIYNESETQRSRRTSSSLVPVPSVRLDAMIERHARYQGLDPRLVQAVVQTESGYNIRALSRKGAMGLMQLMPATAKMLKVTDPYDPDENLRGGTTYLRRMLDRYGSLDLALAAYNAGPTAVDKYQSIPPYRETRNYVRKIRHLYSGTSNGTPSALLQDHARSQAQDRERRAERESSESRGGDPVFVTRDKNGRIVVSTSPGSN